MAEWDAFLSRYNYDKHDTTLSEWHNCVKGQTSPTISLTTLVRRFSCIRYKSSAAVLNTYVVTCTIVCASKDNWTTYSVSNLCRFLKALLGMSFITLNRRSLKIHKTKISLYNSASIYVDNSSFISNTVQTLLFEPSRFGNHHNSV